MRLSLYDRMKMAVGAALGMNWLHGICNIIHRDLKTANRMLTNTTLTLHQLELARKRGERRRTKTRSGRRKEGGEEGRRRR